MHKSHGEPETMNERGQRGNEKRCVIYLSGGTDKKRGGEGGKRDRHSLSANGAERTFTGIRVPAVVLFCLSLVYVRGNAKHKTTKHRRGETEERTESIASSMALPADASQLTLFVCSADVFFRFLRDVSSRRDRFGNRRSAYVTWMRSRDREISEGGRWGYFQNDIHAEFDAMWFLGRRRAVKQTKVAYIQKTTL